MYAGYGIASKICATDHVDEFMNPASKAEKGAHMMRSMIETAWLVLRIQPRTTSPTRGMGSDAATVTLSPRSSAANKVVGSTTLRTLIVVASAVSDVVRPCS